MTLPWDQANETTYATVAAAEAAIIAVGYVRDTNRHIWVNGSRAAKVQRNKKPLMEKDVNFVVQWA